MVRLRVRRMGDENGVKCGELSLRLEELLHTEASRGEIKSLLSAWEPWMPQRQD